MGYNSVCGSGQANYYWLDNVDTSWINTSHWISGEGSNSVEHCGMLLYNTSGTGFYDLYCEYVPSAPHNNWSIEHTLPSACVMRQ